jgi:hypothetical protein
MRRVLVAMGLAVLAGCAGPRMYRCTPGDALSALEEKDSSGAPIIQRAQPIHVTVEGPALAGVTVREQVGDQTVTIARLHVVEGGSSDELRAEYDQLGRENKKPFSGVVAEGFGATFAQLLEKRLTTRLPGSTAKLGGQGELHATPSGELAVENGEYVVRLKMTLLPAHGAASVSVEGVGKSTVPTGHLAWAIPLTVVTFPIGLLIWPPVVEGIDSSHRAAAFARAMDAAAGKLAEEIFRWAAAPLASTAG